MNMNKMTPHIIAVTALVVFIALGLACATNSSIVQKQFQDQSTPWQEQALLMVAVTVPTASRTPLGFPETIFPRIWKIDNVGRKIDGKDYTALPLVSVNQFVVIPPGTHTLDMGAEKNEKYAFSLDKEIQITYDFQPGGRYVVIITHIVNPLVFGERDATFEILTVEEFQAVFKKYRRDYTTPDDYFKSIVLDKFEKAEAELDAEK